MDDKKRVTLLVLNDYLKFDRKIYQIFGVSLGRAISLKAILYFFVAVIVEIVIYFIPLVGSILHVLPAVFLLALPVGVSYLLTGIRTEGRNPIAFFRSVFFYQFRKLRKVTYYRGREIAKPAVYKFNGYATVSYSTQEEILRVLDQPIKKKRKIKQKNISKNKPKIVIQISSQKAPTIKKNLLQPMGLFHKKIDMNNKSSIEHPEIIVSDSSETIFDESNINIHVEKENRLQNQLDSLNTKETTKRIEENENNEIEVITDIDHIVPTDLKEEINDMEDTKGVSDIDYIVPTNLKEDVNDMEDTKGISDIEASIKNIYSLEQTSTQPTLSEDFSQVKREDVIEDFEEKVETINPLIVESQEIPQQKGKIEKKIIRLPIFKLWGKSEQKLSKTGTTVEETTDEIHQEDNSNIHLTQQQMLQQMLLQQNRPSITDLKAQLKEEKRQQKLEKKFEKVMKKGDY